jgi:nucleotide-binding universal stress UspA family protein
LEFAQEIGRPFKARIVIIHVMDPLHAPGRLDSRKLRQLRVEALEEANAKLAEICRNHRKVEHHVINGMVHSEIVAFSNRMQADLIVMGSSGRTGANRFINGSIAEKVVRYAKRPVVVVR